MINYRARQNKVTTRVRKYDNFNLLKLPVQEDQLSRSTEKHTDPDDIPNLKKTQTSFKIGDLLGGWRQGAVGRKRVR